MQQHTHSVRAYVLLLMSSFSLSEPTLVPLLLLTDWRQGCISFPQSLFPHLAPRLMSCWAVDEIQAGERGSAPISVTVSSCYLEGTLLNKCLKLRLSVNVSMPITYDRVGEKSNLKSE